MTTVFAPDLPTELASWLERRQALGQDRYDEVWEGVYHVVPAPRATHGRLDRQLNRLLHESASAAGLTDSSAFNLGEPDDYRVPDGGYHRQASDAVYVPTAAVVVEIVSPRDETYAKLPFYAAHGVDEVLVVDPGLRRVRLYQRRDAGYEETGRSALLGVRAAELAAGLEWPEASDRQA